MATKKTTENVTLVPAARDCARGDILVNARTIVDKETNLVSWWALGFADADGVGFEVLMPEWWRQQYVTESAFPEGLVKGRAYDAGYRPMVDNDGNPVLDDRGRQRRCFYLNEAATK